MKANKFPLYIPTKGRFEYMITSKALTEMGLHHYLVVEEQEAEKYQKAIQEYQLTSEILVLDNQFKKDYELCDEYGLTKSTGPGPARNFAWDHSIKKGYEWHWVMDDNIKMFRMMYKATRIKTIARSIWTQMENFVLRYKNIGMAGPNYSMFAVPHKGLSPFVLNTRIYSCNLIRNSLSYRWRGRYNEDTILSLDLLKAGWCTVQFNMWMQDKLNTQTIKGGNTAEFYHKEGEVLDGHRYAVTGTSAKSDMLFKVHPDVSKVKIKYGRVHHQVDYHLFKKQKLILDENNKISKTNKNYGIVANDPNLLSEIK